MKIQRDMWKDVFRLLSASDIIRDGANLIAPMVASWVPGQDRNKTMLQIEIKYSCCRPLSYCQRALKEVLSGHELDFTFVFGAFEEGYMNEVCVKGFSDVWIHCCFLTVISCFDLLLHLISYSFILYLLYIYMYIYIYYIIYYILYIIYYILYITYYI